MINAHIASFLALFSERREGMLYFNKILEACYFSKWRKSESTQLPYKNFHI